jgi:predicted anti-sigma-YlaC factor YlaD
VYAIFWIVSAGRIVVAALGNETFGAETTLALLAVLFLPVLLLAPLRWRALSRQRRSNSTPADDENVASVLKVVTRERADRAAARRPGRI